jgi:translation elongation factor EF-Tu-like GTPase
MHPASRLVAMEIRDLLTFYTLLVTIPPCIRVPFGALNGEAQWEEKSNRIDGCL